MTARRGLLAVLALMASASVPLVAAGAQTPAPSEDENGAEGPGMTTICDTAPTLTPDSGRPGTVVTVTTDFDLNCAEPPAPEGLECAGAVTGDFEGLTFDLLFDNGSDPQIQGTFVAPVVEPTPPVADAIESLDVVVTCAQVNGAAISEAVAGSYVYPAAVFGLELFADEGQQPTDVENEIVDSGVVNATPAFTG